MAEPSTTVTTLLSASIGLVSFVPGVDGNTLIGAFAGSMLFVMSSKELGLITRVVYLLISIVMGYLLTPTVQAHTYIEEPALAGFLASFLCITLALKIMHHVENTSIFNLIKGKKEDDIV